MNLLLISHWYRPVGGPLGKTPYGGRNWEGFSIDPYLTGVAMYESVVGSQSSGVQGRTFI